MDHGSLSMLLGLAFVYGLIHALDADHIMAVSGLYSAGAGKSGVRLCLSWALGHGLVLLLAGVAVFILGFAMPSRLSELAEYLVGILLLLIGLSLAWQLLGCRARLHFHRHEGLAPHAHWSRQDDLGRTENPPAQHDHRALLVGVVHGAAGAAPVLAVLPLTLTQTPWLFLAYLLMYVTGILLAMLIFGGALGFIIRQLLNYSQNVMQLVRPMAATGSVAMGLWILRGLLPEAGW